MMDILVFGAGAVGSVYAAKLQAAGNNVALLARGQRAVSLRTHGIQLEDVTTGRRATTAVTVVEQLAPTDRYDVIIVTVRLDQLDSVLPILAANHQDSTLLFLLNNPDGMQRIEPVDAQRIVLGFPAVGGIRNGDVVYYYSLNQMPTMLGVAGGQMTPRFHHLAAILKQAGFKTAVSSDIQMWLKTHAILDIALIAAVLITGGSAQLARSHQNVVMLVQSVHEGLLALRALGTPLTPFLLTPIFLWFPRWLTVFLLQVLLRTRMAVRGIDAHLGDDLGELRQMAREIMKQLSRSSLPTPTLNRLLLTLEA